MKKFEFYLHPYIKSDYLKRALDISAIPLTVEHENRFNMKITFHSDDNMYIFELVDDIARRLCVCYQEL